jgi:hypothetical protein
MKQKYKRFMFSISRTVQSQGVGARKLETGSLSFKLFLLAEIDFMDTSLSLQWAHTSKHDYGSIDRNKLIH